MIPVHIRSSIFLLALALVAPAAVRADDKTDDAALVHADLVALDQIIVYNRFGSFDPYGMVFALRRDVSAATNLGDGADAAECALKTGTEPGKGPLEAGKVRLKDCKRPRPLVLRARVGDILRINLTNLLREQQPGISETFCRTGGSSGTLPNIGDIRAQVGHYPTTGVGAPLCDKRASSENLIEQSGVKEAGKDADFPRTRSLSFVIPGIEPIPGPKDEGIVPLECKGLSAISPGTTMTCHYRLHAEGTHLFQSMAAAAGGEGDGGSLTHGLFGALIVEPKGSSFYRSQVPMAAFDKVWKRNDNGITHARAAVPIYAATEVRPAAPDALGKKASNHAPNPCDGVADVPVADMLRDCGTINTGPLDTWALPVREIVHGDINAIIVPPENGAASPGGAGTLAAPIYGKPVAEPFREFVVIFHDELKTFYTKEMESLARFEQFSGIRDGFGINYGASGVGSLVLANRLKIGPSANCPECAYEEFFLESWANGDPALLENYVDDPSNVHHSYLNDRIVFRNFHAGPKETHVFHLHSHQWFAGNDKNRGAYLDSQTIGPQQGMSYDIYGGGAEVYRPGLLVDGKMQKGWYETLGSGNRNRTPGDAIFHCHLYPHFAQGMWELWRVHDALEDGTRTLPDGQSTPGLSLTPRKDLNAGARLGTPVSGPGPALWAGDTAGYGSEGTPIPGVLPVPGQAAPLLPTYDEDRGFPGYPFYIAGEPGHRTPQAPMDIAVENGKRLDGGLGRHVITGGDRISDIAAGPKTEWEAAGIEDRDGVPYHNDRIVPVTVAQKLALGDLTETYHKLAIKLLPPDGTKLERNAMAFHHGGLIEGDAARPLLLRDVSGKELASVPGGVAQPLPVVPDVPGEDATEQEKQAYESASEEYRKASGYASLFIPSPSSARPDAAEPEEPAAVGVFAVNGAAPRPGAPFADPCGAPDSLRGAPFRNPGDMSEHSPLTGRPTQARGLMVGGADKFGGILAAYPPSDMTYDPGLSGFRRFKASAVQFDMVVNKAGWHDPQARINVLSRVSDDYKPGGPRAVSGKEEPFYFRAFSGDCIEFHHTNETPHKLDLDDFQAKVPTDTIGQHIHLVKFDVTSSDGSGNGWNYEDGTFAPDELKERIHTSEGARDMSLLSDTDQQMAKESLEQWHAQCDGEEHLWKLKRSEHPACFQTTVQRWFADPILSWTGEYLDDATKKPDYSDRTLRTVFTHDHFAPSNIQQHGFYNALLIEPVSKDADVYSSERSKDPLMLRASFAPWEDLNGVFEPKLVDALPAEKAAGHPADCNTHPRSTSGGAVAAPNTLLKDCNYSDNGVGARALVEARRYGGSFPGEKVDDELHPNYREFALAIADFALLYDGKRDDAPVPDKVESLDGGEARGLDRLIGEAAFASGLARLGSGAKASKLASLRSKAGNLCEHNRGRYRNTRDPDGPSVIAPAHAVACEIEEKTTAAAWLGKAEQQVRGYFDFYRQEHGKPVYPPERPEAISQSHHDPYLVNYRNEPMPLRVGETASETDLLAGRRCPDYTTTGVREEAVAHADSVNRQKGDGKDSGDMARVFRSQEHGDPCTPLLEAYDGERIMLRLIQGAQEVQHVFTVEGRPFRRNVDQTFPFAARLDADKSKGKGPTRWNDCMLAAERGRPKQFVRWFGNYAVGKRSAEWLANFRALAAECDNIDGFVTAQEIGISEHFEFAGSFSSASGGISESKSIQRQAFLPTDKTGALPLRDSLYHFGTVDALWNGGWGLLRTYGDEGAPDTTKCLDKAMTVKQREACLAPGPRDDWVGDRIDPLEEDMGTDRSERSAEALRAAGSSTGPSDNKIATYSNSASMPSFPDLSCPFLDPSENKTGANPAAYSETRHVFAAVAAFEARYLNSNSALGGLVYDKEQALYDPDGLIFVPLDLDKLALSSPDGNTHTAILQQERAGALDSFGRFGDVEWETLLEAAKDRVKSAGLVPYVQRFNAGDCIHLVVVNGLTETRDGGPVFGDLVGNNRSGLRDRPGDAFLPRITKLNADQIRDGDSDRQDISIGELTPSASLAVTLPLSQLTNVNDVPDPVGANPRLALPPAVVGGNAPYTILTYYAGTVQPKSRELDMVIANLQPSGDDLTKVAAGTASQVDVNFDKPLCKATRPVSGEEKQYGYLVWPSQVLPCAAPDKGQIEANVLGRRYCAAIAEELEDEGSYSVAAAVQAGILGDHAELQACAREAVRLASADKRKLNLKVVPRAFGTLPLKSISDPIGHGTHGLAGTVIIEPKSTRYCVGDSCSSGQTTFESGSKPTAEFRPPESDALPVINPKWTMVKRDEATRAQQVVLKLDKVELPAVNGMPDYAATSLGAATIYESSLLWQDGLNLWDGYRRPFYSAGCVFGTPGCMDAGDPVLMDRRIGGPVPDCEICDDSYDRGEKGVSYGINAFFARLRGRSVPDYDGKTAPVPFRLGPQDWYSQCGWPVYYGSLNSGESRQDTACPWAPGIDKTVNLSAWPHPANLFADDWKSSRTPTLTAVPGAEMMIRIVEPQGRARQRAFVPTGASYHDLFPGFGSGHSTLLAPGKGVTAAMRAPETAGDYLWFDGPRQLMSGGAWGLLRVEAAKSEEPDAEGEGKN